MAIAMFAGCGIGSGIRSLLPLEYSTDFRFHGRQVSFFPAVASSVIRFAWTRGVVKPVFVSLENKHSNILDTTQLYLNSI